MALLIDSVLVNSRLINSVRWGHDQTSRYRHRSALARAPGVFRAGHHQPRGAGGLPAPAGAARADPSAISSDVGAVGQRESQRRAAVGQGHRRTIANESGHPLADAQTLAGAWTDQPVAQRCRRADHPRRADPEGPQFTPAGVEGPPGGGGAARRRARRAREPACSAHQHQRRRAGGRCARLGAGSMTPHERQPQVVPENLGTDEGQRRRPDPLRWIWYAFGGALGPRYRQWVLHDLTCRTRWERNSVRAVVQVMPLALVVLFVL